MLPALKTDCTLRPGDKVNVTLNRDNQQVQVPVLLRNVDGNTNKVAPAEAPSSLDALGASFSAPSQEELGKLGIESGVKVVQLDKGKLRDVGVQEGFIITKIDHQKVTSTSDIEKIMQNKSGGILVEGIYPNGTRAYYAFGA